MACLGMPFVLSYTITIYWIFRGKVRIDRFSYSVDLLSDRGNVAIDCHDDIPTSED